MVIYTNSPKVRRNRRTTVELILSQHNCECVTCIRSGNCSLQRVANDLNIIHIPFKMEIEKQPWSKDFPLIRDSSKCIKCMRCIQVCDKVQSLSIWDVEGTGSRTTINVAGYKKIEEAACSHVRTVYYTLSDGSADRTRTRPRRYGMQLQIRKRL